MFARVITADAQAKGFDGFIRLARQQPGFKGYYVLTDAGTGKLIVISLWEAREHGGSRSRGRGVRHPGRGHPSHRTDVAEPRNLRSRFAGLNLTPLTVS